MLDRLDEIPWETLHHAYGSAGDVPELLRALAGTDAQQEEALYELFGNIWHQGTVYEASSYAVPFLIELAAEPSLTRRYEILGLVGALANGNSYLAVHGRPGTKTGEFLRQDSNFENRLEREQQDVRRTRLAVFENSDVVCRLFEDASPMVRAGAAYVVSRFPEHVLRFGPFLRQAAKSESDPLAQAGMLWCLGAIRDNAPEALVLLETAMESADARQRFAAGIAWYRITGEFNSGAMSVYRQMATATRFGDAFLAGVPWDFSGEVPLEPLLAEIEPDPVAATQTLLTVLKLANAQHDVYPAIVHDLLQLNFVGGNWRECRQLASAQKEVLQSLVETDAAWTDVKRLWFLIPDGARLISQITASDIQIVRDKMRSILGLTSPSV